MVLQKRTTLTLWLCWIKKSSMCLCSFFFKPCMLWKQEEPPLSYTLCWLLCFLKIYSVISPAEAVLTPDCGGEKLQLTHDATAAAAALRSWEILMWWAVFAVSSIFVKDKVLLLLFLLADVHQMSYCSGGGLRSVRLSGRQTTLL